MKLSKTLAIPVATAAVVLVGAGAVLAGTAPSASSAGDAVPAAASPSPAATTASTPVAPYLRSVLDPLVAKGTITGAQEQAIVDAWVAKREELKAERQQLRKFLSDRVLTADELAQLPADSPLQQLKPLMKDGQLTVPQLRALGLGIIRELRSAGIGRGLGQLRGPAPAASPAVGG